MRETLQGLKVDQLNDILSQHAMDSSKLALKWRSPERLVDLIESFPSSPSLGRMPAIRCLELVIGQLLPEDLDSYSVCILRTKG